MSDDILMIETMKTLYNRYNPRNMSTKNGLKSMKIREDLHLALERE
jgi:hypothetical protein